MRMATVNGAKALGTEKLTGSLETGQKADIILFDPDKLRSMPVHDLKATLAYSSSAENIDTVIVNGKTVYRKGVFSCGIDERELAAQIREFL